MQGAIDHHSRTHKRRCD